MFSDMLSEDCSGDVDGMELQAERPIAIKTPHKTRLGNNLKLNLSFIIIITLSSVSKITGYLFVRTYVSKTDKPVVL